MGLSLKTNAWWSLSLTQDQKVVIGRGLAKVTSLMGDLKYFVPVQTITLQEQDAEVGEF